MCRQRNVEATKENSQFVAQLYKTLTSCKVDVLNNFCEVVKEPELLIYILGVVCFALQGILDAPQTLVHIFCVGLHCFCEPFLVLLRNLADLAGVLGLAGVLVLNRPFEEPCIAHSRAVGAQSRRWSVFKT